MPQISIEYSGNLVDRFDVRAFAGIVHQRLIEFAAADLANCKTRLIRLDEVLIGDGSARNGMVHVDLRILPGRTDEQKRGLGEAVIADLEEQTAAGGLDVQLTVEVRQLDGANYHKRRIGG